MASSLRAMLFPAVPRRLPFARGLNVAFRSAHLVTSGALLGGHVFDIAPDRLILFLYLTIASGGCLIALELYRSCQWAYQGMGLLVEIKLAVLIAAGIWWDERVPLVILVVVLGSVGSHMPARYRHYSLRHGRVLEERSSPRP
jgi:hypothetical protein